MTESNPLCRTLHRPQLVFPKPYDIRQGNEMWIAAVDRSSGTPTIIDQGTMGKMLTFTHNGVQYEAMARRVSEKKYH